MTSPISAISGLSGIGGLNAVSGVGGTDALAGASGVGGGAGTPTVDNSHESFASLLSRGLESVQSAQTNADNLAVKVADGTLQDPAQYTMAANEAALGMQLTMAIRNKAVDAFQEIMRMQA